MKTKYLAFAAVALMFASCSNDEDFVPQDNLKDTPITVSADVADLKTRAGYDADNLPAKFYLTVTQTEEVSPYNYTNVEMTKGNGNNYTPSDNILWKDATRTPFVSAYTTAEEVPVSLENGIVDFGFCRIENENLYKNMSGCSSAVIFAATAGVGTDRLIMRCSALSAVEGMVCDCIASSAIEVWCDEVNASAVGERASKPRFSPGYGGVSLSYQADILSFLDAQRKLGITLNDSMMMTPKKSVTAFIGIKG